MVFVAILQAVPLTGPEHDTHVVHGISMPIIATEEEAQVIDGILVQSNRIGQLATILDRASVVETSTGRRGQRVRSGQTLLGMKHRPLPIALLERTDERRHPRAGPAQSPDSLAQP